MKRTTKGVGGMRSFIRLSAPTSFLTSVAAVPAVCASIECRAVGFASD
jgi:hypothetical protein